MTVPHHAASNAFRSHVDLRIQLCRYQRVHRGQTEVAGAVTARGCCFLSAAPWKSTPAVSPAERRLAGDGADAHVDSVGGCHRARTHPAGRHIGNNLHPIARWANTHRSGGRGGGPWVDDWRGGGRRMAVAVPGGFRDAGASLPAVAPLPVAAHPEPVAIRVSDVEWLHQIRVVLLLRYFDRDGSRAVVRRVRLPGHRIHAPAVVVGARRRRRADSCPDAGGRSRGKRP